MKKSTESLSNLLNLTQLARVRLGIWRQAICLCGLSSWDQNSSSIQLAVAIMVALFGTKNVTVSVRIQMEKQII